MTSQIFKQFAAIVVFVFVGVVNINAQQANADDMLQLIAKLQRLEAMQPDSVTFWRKLKRPSARWKK